jgi:predicted DNA-binding protein with PD1-like motif
MSLDNQTLHHAAETDGLRLRWPPIWKGRVMKAVPLVLFLLAMPLSLSAQIIERPPSAQDLKPNSPEVPDAYALSGQFDRIVVMRMKFKTDLLHGIEQMVKAQHIENGVILSGIGSVRGYTIHQVARRDFPSLDMHVSQPSAPADLVAMNGYIVQGNVHAHIVLGTPDKAVAGHLDAGTEVFTFAIVTIGVMNGTNLARVDDETFR